LKCLFVTDLHGNENKFQKLFEITIKEKPEAVFIGGDLLPNQFAINDHMDNFIIDKILKKLKSIKKTKFFIILGNDDPRIFEKSFIDADKEGLISYVNNKTVKFNDYFVTGYSYIPPSPFQLKDWEKYDVSRYTDVGAVSPEEGYRTIEIPTDEIVYSTISEDLEKLAKNATIEKTIFLFHAPPYKTKLDRAALDGKKVDHAPIDVHVGSIAIKRFIEKKHPFLTLHGHVHETVSLTGEWKQKISKTYSFSASHEGNELAIIVFDTEDLEKAERRLI
jgi:Icc-related predicted phosphoesterase